MSQAALWENPNKLFITIIHSCYCKKVKGNTGFWKVCIHAWGKICQGWWQEPCTPRAGLPAWRMFRISCKVPVLYLGWKSWKHVSVLVAAHHCPASADLGTCCRVHMMNKLHIASESCLHCAWEEGNTIVQRCLLETVNVATSPAVGDVTSHRHCHSLPLSLLLQLPHCFAHKNDSFSSLRIFQISGGCCIPLRWNRIRKDGRTSISHKHSTKARLGIFICRIQCLGSTGIEVSVCYQFSNSSQLR